MLNVNRRFYQQSAKGFTLIEVLIALFIFTIVAAIIASVLHSLLKTRESVKQFNNVLANLQLAEATIGGDLSQVVLTPLFLPAIRGGSPLIRLQGDRHQLQFIRGGYVNPGAEENRSTLLAVRYFQQQQGLIRIIVSDPFASQQREGSQTLLTNLIGLELTYYDQHLRTSTIWPPSTKQLGQLPRAVRVTLHLKQQGDLTQFYVIGQGAPVE